MGSSLNFPAAYKLTPEQQTLSLAYAEECQRWNKLLDFLEAQLAIGKLELALFEEEFSVMEKPIITLGSSYAKFKKQLGTFRHKVFELEGKINYIKENPPSIRRYELAMLGNRGFSAKL